MILNLFDRIMIVIVGNIQWKLALWLFCFFVQIKGMMKKVVEEVLN